MICLRCHRKVVAGLKLNSLDLPNHTLSRRSPLFMMNTLKLAWYFKEVIITGGSTIIIVMLTLFKIFLELLLQISLRENTRKSVSLHIQFNIDLFSTYHLHGNTLDEKEVLRQYNWWEIYSLVGTMRNVVLVLFFLSTNRLSDHSTNSDTVFYWI